jgi:hypothetical protein
MRIIPTKQYKFSKKIYISFIFFNRNKYLKTNKNPQLIKHINHKKILLPTIKITKKGLTITIDQKKDFTKSHHT